MDDIQRAIHCMEVITDEAVCEECDYYPLCDHVKQADVARTIISAMQELQRYRMRIEQLKQIEVRQFECKLPDGRICHFSYFIEFLEKGQVE